jgi:hypothetical protein
MKISCCCFLKNIFYSEKYLKLFLIFTLQNDLKTPIKKILNFFKNVFETQKQTGKF